MNNVIWTGCLVIILHVPAALVCLEPSMLNSSRWPFNSRKLFVKIYQVESNFLLYLILTRPLFNIETYYDLTLIEIRYTRSKNINSAGIADNYWFTLRADRQWKTADVEPNRVHALYIITRLIRGMCVLTFAHYKNCNIHILKFRKNYEIIPCPALVLGKQVGLRTRCPRDRHHHGNPHQNRPWHDTERPFNIFYNLAAARL